MVNQQHGARRKTQDMLNLKINKFLSSSPSKKASYTILLGNTYIQNIISIKVGKKNSGIPKFVYTGPVL